VGDKYAGLGSTNILNFIDLKRIKYIFNILIDLDRVIEEIMPPLPICHRDTKYAFSKKDTSLGKEKGSFGHALFNLHPIVSLNLEMNFAKRLLLGYHTLILPLMISIVSLGKDNVENAASINEDSMYMFLGLHARDVIFHITPPLDSHVDIPIWSNGLRPSCNVLGHFELVQSSWACALFLGGNNSKLIFNLQDLDKPKISDCCFIISQTRADDVIRLSHFFITKPNIFSRVVYKFSPCLLVFAIFIHMIHHETRKYSWSQNWKGSYKMVFEKNVSKLFGKKPRNKYDDLYIIGIWCVFKLIQNYTNKILVSIRYR
ncbi:hypothetical protein ACJX0J_034115, partial [Zea mays]